MVITGLFLVVLVWAVVATIFCFIRNPLPFPDRGHRCFAVTNEKAAKTVVGILGKMGGLPERFTFDPGPTHQTLLWDNTTVIIRHDAAIKAGGLASNAISLVVRDPRESALQAVRDLRTAGFQADAHFDVLGGEKPLWGKERFVLVTSDAFDGWNLAFRLHVLKMGPPPRKHKLLP